MPTPLAAYSLVSSTMLPAGGEGGRAACRQATRNFTYAVQRYVLQGVKHGSFHERQVAHCKNMWTDQGRRKGLACGSVDTRSEEGIAGHITHAAQHVDVHALGCTGYHVCVE
jgi:hypothetical protein